jgi:prepilin-type N-terminal cleavage/methylation domain-containing protein
MNKKNKGFTLVELITTVAILAVVMGMLGGAMLSTLQAFGQHRSRQRMHRYESETRLAMLGMVRDIRLSHEVLQIRNAPPVGESSRNNVVVLQLRARLGSNAYRTISYSLVTNTNWVDPVANPTATVVPRYRLTRNVSNPHQRLSAPGANDADPPPGGGSWSDWPVNFQGAYVDDAQVRAIFVPQGTFLFETAGEPRPTLSTDDLTAIEHLNIRLIPDDDRLDYMGELTDSAIVRFFSTTTALRRSPLL